MYRNDAGAAALPAAAAAAAAVPLSWTESVESCLSFLPALFDNTELTAEATVTSMPPIVYRLLDVVREHRLFQGLRILLNNKRYQDIAMAQFVGGYNQPVGGAPPFTSQIQLDDLDDDVDMQDDDPASRPTAQHAAAQAVSNADHAHTSARQATTSPGATSVNVREAGASALAGDAGADATGSGGGGGGGAATGGGGGAAAGVPAPRAPLPQEMYTCRCTGEPTLTTDRHCCCCRSSEGRLRASQQEQRRHDKQSKSLVCESERPVCCAIAAHLSSPATCCVSCRLSPLVQQANEAVRPPR